MSQRPDIVFHIPAEESGTDVRGNNFAVFALKRRASKTDAEDDFQKLDEMCERLDYSVAVFVNVDSEDTHRRAYTGTFHDRMHAFGVVLEEGAARVVGG